MIAVFQGLKDCHVEDGAELFRVVSETRKGSMGLNYTEVDFG